MSWAGFASSQGNEVAGVNSMDAHGPLRTVWQYDTRQVPYGCGSNVCHLQFYLEAGLSSSYRANVCSDCHIGTLASEHTTTGPAATPTKVGCTTGGYAGNTPGCHNTTTGAIAPSCCIRLTVSVCIQCSTILPLRPGPILHEPDSRHP